MDENTLKIGISVLWGGKVLGSFQKQKIPQNCQKNVIMLILGLGGRFCAYLRVLKPSPLLFYQKRVKFEVSYVDIHEESLLDLINTIFGKH